MIIDAHTHIRLPGHESKAVPELLKAMDTAGIDKAAVFASTLHHLQTQQLLSEIALHADRLFAVGSVSPLRPAFDIDAATLDRWLESGMIRALKFYTGYEHFFPYDPRLRTWLEALAKHKRPAIFHLGDCYSEVPGARLEFAQPLPIDRLAVEMPDLTIIMAHMAQPWIVDAAQVCYKNKNVYVDIAGFTYGAFDERHERIFCDYWHRFDDGTYGQAHERILFGSDWPISDMTDYVRVVRDLAGPHADAIFHGTAARLFGL